MAEYMDRGGETWSWYCGVCIRALGADLDNTRHHGESIDGCPEHGHDDLAWETWNVECEPTYPHNLIESS